MISKANIVTIVVSNWVGREGLKFYFSYNPYFFKSTSSAYIYLIDLMDQFVSTLYNSLFTLHEKFEPLHERLISQNSV